MTTAITSTNELVIRRSRIQLVLILIGVIFLLMGATSMIESVSTDPSDDCVMGLAMNVISRQVIGWFGMIFFGLVFLTLVVQLFTNRVSLRLTRSGFIVSTLFGEKPMIHWGSIRDIRVESIGNFPGSTYSRNVVVFDTPTGPARLSDCYGLKARDLARLMVQWQIGDPSSAGIVPTS